ncbi:MAG: 50S ribosomal protein L18 [Candidatus Beckwithbacteria bacterium]|nr:50S ribosomal protein L18 [Candidatus Beckwithbacteria bacterium]
MIKRYSNQKMGRIVRVRSKTKGTALRPRLTVFRSLKHLYAQIIDDDKGVTLAAASGSDPDSIGATLAKTALAKKIKAVVFDRGPYQYHGRIKALAEAARKAGLNF